MEKKWEMLKNDSDHHSQLDNLGDKKKTQEQRQRRSCRFDTLLQSYLDILLYERHDLD
ncbi:hypothetical protein YC2023_037050 [Brassica napus]